MNSSTHIIRESLLKRIVLQSAKLPIFYLLIGTILIATSYIDDFIPIEEWKNLLGFSAKVGNVLIVLSVLTFIYKIIVLLCCKYENYLREKHAIASLILSSMRKGLRIIFALISINIIVLLFGPSKFYLIVANNVLNTIIIMSIGWVALQVLYTCEAILYQQMITLTQKENIRVKALYTKMHIIRNIATVLIVVITIAAVLMSFNSVRNIGISLLASAGFLTAIVGLSAQKTLFSLFTGLQIALTQPIKIGDIVVIEKVTGIIEEITFTYVTLKLGDKRRLIVPINYFIEKPFENWSREEDSLRNSMHFYVDYMLPIDAVRKEVESILENSKYWDKQAGKVEVSNLTERAAEIRVQVSAANADDLGELKAEVREKLLSFIREKFPDHFPKVRFEPQIALAEGE